MEVLLKYCNKWKFYLSTVTNGNFKITPRELIYSDRQLKSPTAPTCLRSVVQIFGHRRRYVLNCHLWPVQLFHISFFFTLFHKWHDFRKEIIEHEMCVLISPQLSSEIYLIIRTIPRDIIILHRS